MKNALEKLEEILEQAMENPIHPVVWALGFFGIIAVRMFIEFFVASSAMPVNEILAEYLHNFFFFLLSFLLIWLVLSLILKENPARLSRLILWASWLIILPPLIDIIRTGGEVYWSFYALNSLSGLWGQFWTIFGRLPSGIVYFGTRITFILAIIFSGVLVLIRSKNWIKSGLAALSTYIILFFMGTFPSFFTFGYYFFEKSKKVSAVNEMDIIQLFGVPAKLFGTEFNNLKYSLAYNLDLIYYLLLLALLVALFFMADKKKVQAVVKNARFPQLIYHAGLLFAGLGMGFLVYPQNFNLNLFSVLATMILTAGVWLAWIASVIVNDIYDFKIDEISNPDRPLQKKIFNVREYGELGVIVFLLSILGGLVIGLKFTALLFIYQFIAWVYSATPFRLKKFPVLATLISAAASLVVFFIGFTLMSGDQNIQGLSFRIILLLIAALTLSLPIKDFKDIEGDKKYDIWTIPVLLGEEKGRMIVSASVFLSFMLSVFLLNESRLFWWAVFFGGISYLIISSQKINPRNLFWWVLCSVGAYGLILVKIVFL